jgi:acetolactate synthase-1/2/3 large subunit
MGFALPGAIGAKLAKPDTPVVCISGDGDFMMCIQELALRVMNNIPVWLVLNNSGYMSIRDGQKMLMGGNIISEFSHHAGDGSPYSVDIAPIILTRQRLQHNYRVASCPDCAVRNRILKLREPCPVVP